MSKHLTLALLAFILLPGYAWSAASSPLACQKPVMTGKTFTMTCAYNHRSGPLTLIMAGAYNKKTNQLKSQTIKVLANGTLRQTLTPDSDGNEWLDNFNEQAITSIDLNFDGYDDLKVWSAAFDEGPDRGYSYWLYNPDKKLFERRTDLDKPLSSMNVTTDAQTKTITAEWDNFDGGENTVKTYHWEKNTLVLNENSANQSQKPQ